MYTLEVACGNMDSVHAAINGGADRIELCAALSVGGITPGDGFIRHAIEVSNVPVFVMIRPREGDFVYTQEEFEIMLKDITRCRELQVQGVVAGMLHPDGNIDVERSAKLVEAAGSMSVTFHRAFDLSKDPLVSLEAIIQCGFHRLLTSGQEYSAPTGAACISQLMKQNAGRIQIMAGAGVNAQNVVSLIQNTGVREVHLSGKTMIPGKMTFKRNTLTMGTPDSDEYSLAVTDPHQIQNVRTLLDSLHE